MLLIFAVENYYVLFHCVKYCLLKLPFFVGKNSTSTGLLGYAKPIKVDLITAEALKSCHWPGRFQILNKKMKHGNLTYFLDGAHTKESVELCAQWFNDLSNGLASR